MTKYYDYKGHLVQVMSLTMKKNMHILKYMGFLCSETQVNIYETLAWAALKML